MFDHINSYPHGSIAYYLEGQTRRPQSSRDFVDKISVETDVRVGEQDSSSRLLVRANPSSVNTFIVDDKSRVNVSAHDKANIGTEEDVKCDGIYEFDDNCGAGKSPKVIVTNLAEDVKAADDDITCISMLAVEDIADVCRQDDNVRHMVDKAAELFNVIHEEICGANRMLLSSNKFSAVIPSKSVMLLRTSLLNDMSSLMKEILSRGTLLEKLRDEKDKMVLEVENLRGELEKAQRSVARFKAEDLQRDCRDKNEACAHLVQLDESKAYVTGIVQVGNTGEVNDKAELEGLTGFVPFVMVEDKVKSRGLETNVVENVFKQKGSTGIVPTVFVECKVKSRGLETKVVRKEFESKVKVRETQRPVMGTVIKTKNDYGKSSKKVFRRFENKSFKSDTVVIGGRNANKLARAIGANHWSTNVLKDVDFLSKVDGGTVKRIIFLPSGDIFFHRRLDLAHAFNLYVSLFDQLSKLDAVEVFVLPVFRNCYNVNASCKLNTWYMKNAQVDGRFIGKQHVAGKNLFQWMDATNGAKSRRQYVNAQEIVTKDGVKRLCEYLNVFDNDMKVPDCAVRKNFVRTCRSTQPTSINLVRDSSTQSIAAHSYAGRTWYNSNIKARSSNYQSACSTNPNKEIVYGCYQPRARKKKRKFIPINGDVYLRKEGRVENIRH